MSIKPAPKDESGPIPIIEAHASSHLASSERSEISINIEPVQPLKNSFSLLLDLRLRM